MNHDTGTARRSQYVTIFESELRAIAAIAAERRGIETGGVLFGQFSHAARPSIWLALPPGRNAIHQASFFEEDIDHVKGIDRLLGEHYGIRSIGTHHSHHELGLDDPSSVDVNQVRSVSQRNGFPTWVQIISTHRRLHASKPSQLRWRRTTSREDGCTCHSDPVRIRVNSFFYSDARNGQGARCGIRVLPGISPVRASLITSGLLDDSVLGFQGFQFSTDRIDFDDAQPDSEPEQTLAVPDALIDQIRELPDSLQDQLSATLEEDLIIVTLPLPEAFAVYVAYAAAEPVTIKAIEMARCGSDTIHDVAGHLIKKNDTPRLRTIYEHCRDTVASHSDNTGSWTREGLHDGDS